MGISWSQLGNKLVKQAKDRKVPITGQFELTARCNLKCKMCYVCRPAGDRIAIEHELSAKEWIQLAGEARDAGMLYLLLTGGEVFLRRDFKEIYEEMSGMGFGIEIYTNATMITPDVAKWLGKIPPLKMEVSLYGASKEAYSKVCGYAEGFESAIRGIDFLREEGITLELRTTVIHDNSSDFEKIAELAGDRGIKLGIVNYVSPRRDEHNRLSGVERLSPRELVEYEIKVEEYFRNRADDISSSAGTGGKAFAGKSDDESTAADAPVKEGNSPFYCTAGTCAFWITWDGRMLPCGLADSPHTLPSEKGFYEAWRYLQELCNSTPHCKECRECELKDYCMTCPAALKNETGSFDIPSKYLCEHARLRKLYKNNRR
ncbi:MAG: radical SAM protein [Clostridia bacterium]|nr:radical SAM protein [Clostridia bacterium]